MNSFTPLYDPFADDEKPMLRKAPAHDYASTDYSKIYVCRVANTMRVYGSTNPKRLAYCVIETNGNLTVYGDASQEAIEMAQEISFQNHEFTLRRFDQFRVICATIAADLDYMGARLWENRKNIALYGTVGYGFLSSIAQLSYIAFTWIFGQG